MERLATRRGPATAGERASPKAELRALPRRPRGPTRRTFAPPRISVSSSRGGGNSYRDMETPGDSRDGLRAQRCRLATPCRAHIPSSGVRALGHRTGRGEACSRGGAALPPAAEASGSREPACRPGRDLPRARRRGAQRTRRFLRSCLRAAAGWQARRSREARGGGRQGWRRPREARLGCAARRLRPRAGARCEAAASERLRRQGCLRSK